MLNSDKLLEWFQEMDLLYEGRKLIEHIRASEPVRRVEGRAGNMTAQYPSLKMGRVIQAESHKVELAGVYEYEYDFDVWEYWDQPCQIKLAYKLKDGRNHGARHTPDYFVIRRSSAGFEEWKTEEKLLELATDQPFRYVRDENNQWRCPPGEEVAQRVGLYYRVRSDAEINWNFYLNVEFLNVYYRKKPIVDPEIVSEIFSISHIAWVVDIA